MYMCLRWSDTSKYRKKSAEMRNIMQINREDYLRGANALITLSGTPLHRGQLITKRFLPLCKGESSHSKF